MTTVAINGKEYTLAPLRMKHLKQLTELIENPKGKLLERLDAWTPFILFSIQEGGSPSFTISELDELTMEQLVEVWVAVQKASGINIVQKSGETKPNEPTGTQFTAA